MILWELYPLSQLGVKTIFQLLCKDKLEWGEKISREIEIIWTEFFSKLANLKSLRVKRLSFCDIKEKIESVQLHGFSDSSTQIYCGVLYLRVQTS